MTDGLSSCFRISRSGRISACGRISNSSSRHNESRRLLGRPSRRGATSRSNRDLGDRYPHELSGGEQRVALARSLVGEPRILLLDEPLSSLDSELRVTLRQELARLQHALQLTTVYVTHDREDASSLADSIVEMRAGRIVSISEMNRKALG